MNPDIIFATLAKPHYLNDRPMTTTYDLQRRLGAIIRFARLTAKLTQVQLGKKLKVPDTYE